MKTWFIVLALIAMVFSQEVDPTEEVSCGEDILTIIFTNLKGGANCQVRVSDLSGVTNGLLLLDKIPVSHVLCLNPGYYYIGCTEKATVNVKFLSYDENHQFDNDKLYKILSFDFEKAEFTTLPSTHKNANFDRNTPITGELPYPTDYTTEEDDFPCTQAGYVQYLSKWPEDIKVTPRDPFSEDFKTRLEYFVDSCLKIHNWNTRNSYKMEFTFYADWHPDEFEEITTNKQRYTGVNTPVPSYTTVWNNTNNRYLMPSLDPCNDEIEGGNNLRPYIAAPQNCSVTWAFAITNSIEYSIKKLYLEEYDQIISVALSAQELIDCVAEEHNLKGEACEGLPLIWGFDYIFENGIAYRQFYPHTNKEEECKTLEESMKYHIEGYEKPEVFNKHGLFELVQRGPTAVTLGLDPEFFQYYRNDRAEGPYFNTGFYRPSVYGVVVEYRQYEVDGEEAFVEWPYFAIESRLRACDSFVFRLPIRESNNDANIAGIAGFAIRPIVNEMIPTPEPPTLPPTPTPTPTPEPWFPIYDPFILGDNCNYYDPASSEAFLSDQDVLAAYLAVRDAYPTKALKHTRVLALAGMTEVSIQMFETSLAAQTEPALNNIDCYFYGDKMKSRVLNADEIIPLLRLTQYTKPKRLVFAEGVFYREGFETLLHWMSEHKEYFQDLEYFEVSKLKIHAYAEGTTAEALNELTDKIVGHLQEMCNATYYPKLTKMVFNNNGYTEDTNNSLQTRILQACKNSHVNVTALESNVNRNAFPKMCGGSDMPTFESYPYYDLSANSTIVREETDTLPAWTEKDQCRFTWNWEFESNMYNDYNPTKNCPFNNPNV